MFSIFFIYFFTCCFVVASVRILKCHEPCKNKDLLFPEVRQLDNASIVNEDRCNMTNLIYISETRRDLQPYGSIFSTQHKDDAIF